IDRASLQNDVFCTKTDIYLAVDACWREGEQLARPDLDGGQPFRCRNHLAALNVIDADDPGHVQVARSGEDVLSRAALTDATAVHHDDMIAQYQGLEAIMGDDDCWYSQLCQPMSQITSQLLAAGYVQSRERLIQQQEARPTDQRPGQRYALLLTSRKLPWVTVLQAGEIKQIGNLRNSPRPLGIADAPNSVINVPLHCQVRKQRIFLKQIADLASLRRNRNSALRVEPDLIGETDVAASRLLESGQAAQCSRLSRAGRTEQDGDRKSVERPVQAHLHRRAVGEALLELGYELRSHIVPFRLKKCVTASAIKDDASKTREVIAAL